MDLNERTFELLGNRLSELEYMCGLNDTVSEKTDYVTLDLLDSSLGLSAQSVNENLEPVTLPPAGMPDVERETVTDTQKDSTFEFVRGLQNTNTRRKNESDLRKFNDYLTKNDEHRNPEEIPVYELDMHLARFFINAKKASGEDYEPDTLKYIQGSVNRYLAEKKLNINIITDKEFKHSLDLLRQLGKGNREKIADPLTPEEIDLLYEKNLLGTGDPKSLMNVLYLNNTMHFEMRSRAEHISLRLGDVQQKVTSTREEYLEYRERSTKTRTGVTNNPRCPVLAYKEFARRRPEQMNSPNQSPFYLRVSRHPEKAWYVNQPMGKNTIGNIVKVMCEAGGIQGRKVNHSERKTAISSLVHAGVPPTIIKQKSGHKNVNSINNYNTASNEQQRHMSSILTNYSSSCSEPTVTEFDSSSSSLDKFSSVLPSTCVTTQGTYGLSVDIDAQPNTTSDVELLAKPCACYPY
uniref:Tyr recombinase domain-containing protein n=1 Tax=Magallana gigas TaxID=29159 RepID=A0A8W8NP22_MAGGI